MFQPVPLAITDAIAWLVIVLFVTGWFLDSVRTRGARHVTVTAWVVLAVFWFLLIPRFAFAMRSPIETVLCAIAVPSSLSAGYLLWTGRDSLTILSRAIAVMGIIYLPFETIPVLHQWLIETVAYQTYRTIILVGFDVSLAEGPVHGYRSALVFTTNDHTYITHIVLACTGIGSISIFAGLIAAINASVSRKLQALGLATVIIYILNIIRNVFIAIAFGNQWFQLLVDPIMTVTGYADPALVSFFIADRVLSQSFSVVALIGITWLVVRIVPELLEVLEDALFVVTRTEYDLHTALSIDGR